MALAIRLARGGAKKRPYYRIVVADSRAPRDGRFIEKLGTYNPLLGKEDEKRVVLDAERATHWLGVGAQPTDRVARFLDKAGVKERAARNNPTKGKPGEKAVELIKQHVRSTFRREVVGDIGGFGGLFAIDWKQYKNPLLVSSTDGVGTKSLIARLANRRETIGIDCVAMSVDDIAARAGSDPAWHAPDELIDVMLGDDPAAIVDAVTAALEAGAPVTAVSRAVSYAAAMRSAGTPDAATAFISRAPSMWVTRPCARAASATASSSDTGQTAPPPRLAVCSTTSIRCGGA